MEGEKSKGYIWDEINRIWLFDGFKCISPKDPFLWDGLKPPKQKWMMSATETWLFFRSIQMLVSVNQLGCRFEMSSKDWNRTWLNHRKCGLLETPCQFWISLVLIHPFWGYSHFYTHPTPPLVEHRFTSNISALGWVRVTLVGYIAAWSPVLVT